MAAMIQQHRPVLQLHAPYITLASSLVGDAAGGGALSGHNVLIATSSRCQLRHSERERVKRIVTGAGGSIVFHMGAAVSLVVFPAHRRDELAYRCALQDAEPYSLGVRMGVLRHCLALDIPMVFVDYILHVGTHGALPRKIASYEVEKLRFEHMRTTVRRVLALPPAASGGDAVSDGSVRVDAAGDSCVEALPREEAELTTLLTDERDGARNPVALLRAAFSRCRALHYVVYGAPKVSRMRRSKAVAAVRAPQRGGSRVALRRAAAAHGGSTTPLLLVHSALYAAQREAEVEAHARAVLEARARNDRRTDGDDERLADLAVGNFMQVRGSQYASFRDQQHRQHAERTASSLDHEWQTYADDAASREQRERDLAAAARADAVAAANRNRRYFVLTAAEQRQRDDERDALERRLREAEAALFQQRTAAEERAAQAAAVERISVTSKLFGVRTEIIDARFLAPAEGAAEAAESQLVVCLDRRRYGRNRTAESSRAAVERIRDVFVEHQQVFARATAAEIVVDGAAPVAYTSDAPAVDTAAAATGSGALEDHFSNLTLTDALARVAAVGSSPSAMKELKARQARIRREHEEQQRLRDARRAARAQGAARKVTEAGFHGAEDGGKAELLLLNALQHARLRYTPEHIRALLRQREERREAYRAHRRVISERYRRAAQGRFGGAHLRAQRLDAAAKLDGKAVGKATRRQHTPASIKKLHFTNERRVAKLKNGAYTESDDRKVFVGKLQFDELRDECRRRVVATRKETSAADSDSDSESESSNDSDSASDSDSDADGVIEAKAAAAARTTDRAVMREADALFARMRRLSVELMLLFLRKFGEIQHYDVSEIGARGGGYLIVTYRDQGSVARCLARCRSPVDRKHFVGRLRQRIRREVKASGGERVRVDALPQVRLEQWPRLRDVNTEKPDSYFLYNSFVGGAHSAFLDEALLFKAQFYCRPVKSLGIRAQRLAVRVAKAQAVAQGADPDAAAAAVLLKKPAKTMRRAPAKYTVRRGSGPHKARGRGSGGGSGAGRSGGRVGSGSISSNSRGDGRGRGRGRGGARGGRDGARGGRDGARGGRDGARGGRVGARGGRGGARGGRGGARGGRDGARGGRVGARGGRVGARGGRGGARGGRGRARGGRGGRGRGGRGGRGGRDRV